MESVYSKQFNGTIQQAEPRELTLKLNKKKKLYIDIEERKKERKKEREKEREREKKNDMKLEPKSK